MSNINIVPSKIYNKLYKTLIQQTANKVMNIAIQGCLHGELDEVYKQLRQLQKSLQIKIDLLIICGDFQALRDQTDLDYLHCPQKYKSMGSFFKYFQSQEEPPILTIFIGGNHEAVNYMRSTYFGGWVAKNIYYLGQAGSVYVKKGQHKIRVSGLSGIYNHRDFQYVLRPQKIPLYGGAKISAYHVKQLEIYRLELMARINQMKKEEPKTYGNNHKGFDIFLSHDWPKNIALFGKTSELYKYKPFLEKQINSGVFGSPPSERLMKLAIPSYWFSAHMHVKYPAIYPHNQNEFTHFLALDKCLQKRSCLQVLNFKSQSQEKTVNQELNEKTQIILDPIWLTVLSLTEHLQNKGDVLYTFDEKSQEYKLSNSKMMNEMIMKFPETFESLFAQNTQQNQNLSQFLPIPVPQFDENNQFIQTQKILNLCKIQKPKNLQGTIFPKGYFGSQTQHSFEKQQLKGQNICLVKQTKNESKEESFQVIQERNGEPVDDEIELDL